MKSRRYLGSWILPSGNGCHVYLGTENDELRCEWDTPPSPLWPAEDRIHYNAVTFPEIVRAVATATGKKVLGVSM